jgi:hypothetical protein
MDDALVPVVVGGLAVTVLLVAAAVRGRAGNPPAQTRARWAGAALAGLLTVGATGIALLRAVA